MDVINANRVLKGNTLKLAIVWSYPSDVGVTLDSIDFTLQVFCSDKLKISIDKEDLYHDADGWFAYIDTCLTGIGRLKFRLLAEIPDLNAPGGIKKDYSETFDPNIVVYV